MKSAIKTKNKSVNGIIILLLIFCSPDLLLILLSVLDGNWHIALIRFFNTIVCAIIFSLPAILLVRKGLLYFYFLSLLSFIIPFLLFTILIYHKLPTRWIFSVILQSTKVELVEFLNGQWLLLISAVVLPVLVLLVTKHYISAPITLDRKKKAWLLAAIVVLFSFVSIGKLYQRQSSYKLLKTSVYTFFNNTPIQTTKRFISAFNAHNNTKQYITLNASNKALIEVNGNKTPKVVVLILGESARYSNWSINGYKRNTSPLLLQQNNLLSFTNIISPSFSTIQSIPFISTTANPNSFNEKPHTTLSTLFKKAGYNTYWLSTQTSQGNIIGAIASESDSCIYIGHKSMHVSDSELIPILEYILSNTNQNSFIILHTNGSHYPYQNRYSKDFNQFTPSVKRNRHILMKSKNKQKVINSYDNSILHTDAFIQNIINTINKTHSALLCYVSDHGENLFDKDAIGFGRGYGQISKKLYHVPLFIWANNKHMQDISNEWKNLEANLNKKGSTISVAHTLASLSGIKWKGFDSTICLSHSAYNCKQRYFIYKNKVLDYDDYFEINKE